jgi:radical SAM superfamily enzyme YgiQ (UPF0313 family)
MALAGVLEQLGYVVRMFHAAANQALWDALQAFNPDFMGMSTMTMNYPEGRRVAEWAKRWRPNLPIALGGWHASGCVQAHLLGQESESLGELLSPSSPFDYVVAGEGEQAMPDLLRKLEQGSPIEAGDGVSLFRNGQMRVSPPAKRIRDLAALAMPSWSGLGINTYRDLRDGALDLSVHFNRGCRFKCGFCATPVVYGPRVTCTPAAQAVVYIRHILETYHPQVVTFTDEDFFAHISWVEELVGLLEQGDLASRHRVSFDTFASINDLIRLKEKKEDLLGRMKKAGFRLLTVGVESFNAKVLLQYNKEQMILATMSPQEREKYRKADPKARGRLLVASHYAAAQEAINAAFAHGLLVMGDCMIGNPGETEAEVRAGFEMFAQLRNLPLAYIPIFIPFPGTGVWKQAYKSGLLARTSQGGIDWTRFNPSVGATDLSYPIKELRDELEVKFYTSARYREDMLATLKSNPGLEGLFDGRFDYLDRTFPGDSRIKAIRDLLK